MLKSLLEEAEAGDIDSLLFCTRKNTTFLTAATGVFLREPLIAIAAMTRMQALFTRLSDNDADFQENAYRGSSF